MLKSQLRLIAQDLLRKRLSSIIQETTDFEIRRFLYTFQQNNTLPINLIRKSIIESFGVFT
jgi:hypothetical protein